jgi:hypothetical protein
MEKTARRFAFGEVLLLVLLVAQLALYVFMWLRFQDDRAFYGSDFISFYTAGRIARSGDFHALYDLDTQRRVQAEVLGENTFPGGANLSQHPPYLALVLAGLAVDDFVQSYMLWTVVRLPVLLACGWLVHRFFRGHGWEARPALWNALAAMAFFPVFLGILGGQDAVWILAALLLWWNGLAFREEALAGVGLALATLAPTIAGALALPLLASRRPAAVWFLAALVPLGLYTLLLIGRDGLGDFLGLMTLSASGDQYGLNPAAMVNLLGLLLRTFPGLSLETARLISWGALLAAAALLIALWWGKGRQLRLELVGLAVTLAVFTSPHLHSHSLAFLLLPALAVCLQLGRLSRPLGLALLPVLSIAMLLASFFSLAWSYALAYLTMLALAAALTWNLVRGQPAAEAR